MNRTNQPRFTKKFGAPFAISLAATCATSALGAGVLEETVVTAQKRSESVQDVPIAIQAISGEDLNALGVQTAADVTKLAPNINISTQNPVSQAINIRGVGTNDFFSNATGSVGLYMDEVTMSAPALSGLGLFDLERVEIMRGPQNSLFGRNTTGGAINFISNIPQVGGDSDGYVSATYGSYNRIELEGAASFQLSNTAAIRLAAKSYDRDGNFDNQADGGADFGEKDRKSLRGTFVFEPSDSSTLIANVHWAREDSQITPYRKTGRRGVNGSPEFFTIVPGPVPQGPREEQDWTTDYGAYNAQGQRVDTTDWQKIHHVTNDELEVEAVGVYIKFIHDMEWASFTGIASWDDSETAFSLDLGGPGWTDDDLVMVSTQDHENEQISVELRLASPPEDRFRWIGGMYLFSEEATYHQNMGFGPFAFDEDQPLTVPGGPPLPGQPVGGSFGLLALTGSPNGYGNQASFSSAELENDVISPYLHTEFDITDELTLTFGLRYTDDTKKASSIVSGNVDTSSLSRTTFRSKDVMESLAASVPVCEPRLQGLPCTADLTRPDLEFEEFGGKLGLGWQMNDYTLIYGSYSRGFRSGKYDIEFFHGPHTGFSIQDLDVETLDAFEVGVKSDLLEGSMKLNLAAFHYTWNDQQLFIVDPMSGPTFTNIEESTLMGVEVELKWAPAEGWLIQGGLGFLDTEVTDVGSNPTGLVEDGHELPNSPQLSGNLLVIYDVEVGDGLLSLQTDMAYREPSKTNVFFNPTVDEYDEFFQVNARISYTFGPEDQYQVAAFGDNLNEEQQCSYETNLFAFSGTNYCIPNDGEATYGISASLRF